MTSELQDLAAVVLDGDLVVRDARAGRTNLLPSGAATMWIALEDGGVPGVVEHVTDAVGVEPGMLVDEVDSLLRSFRGLGLFEGPGSSPRLGDLADESVVGG